MQFRAFLVFCGMSCVLLWYELRLFLWYDLCFCGMICGRVCVFCGMTCVFLFFCGMICGRVCGFLWYDLCFFVV